MIYGLYFRFYKSTHCKHLSVVLAYAARFLFFLRFLIRKLTLKREIVTLDTETAERLLYDTYPDPMGRPGYKMEECDEEVDLSVIVPVYNHKEMTVNCIESILNQKTGFRFELILVDDGSTDGIQKKIDRYKDKNVIVIHQKNSGIAAARNTGIENAHGRYLMFIDCDDSVHEDIIEKMMKQAASCDADIVMCGHELVKIRNGKVYSRIPNLNPQVNLLGYRNKDEIMNYAGLPWGKVYRRTLWKNVRFFPGYWYEDDIIHGLIFPQCKTFIYVPEIEYEYMWHDTNFSHTQGGKQQVKAIDRYWLLKAVAERYEELGLEQNAQFYTMLLEHVSAYYYPGISSLPENIVQAMFIAGRELLMKYKPAEPVKLPYMLRKTETAILDKDIAMWKLCSVNQ